MAVSYAISTWSLNRTLRAMELVDIPAELHRRGFDAVQFCHFDLPSRDSGYLSELRSSLDEADITLDALLIDDGDLTDPSDADGQQAWIGAWLDTAVELGADKARVIAGKSTPTPERLAASGRRLVRLAADHPEIRVVTENWLGLMPTAANVRTVLDPADHQVGLLIDLGNWTGADKYDELAAIADLAETCHAKCHADADGLHTDDFRRSLNVLKAAGYAGPLALVYDGPDDDEWAHLEQELAVAHDVFDTAPTDH